TRECMRSSCGRATAALSMRRSAHALILWPTASSKRQSGFYGPEARRQSAATAIPIMTDEIRDHFQESALVLDRVAGACSEAIARSANVLLDAFRKGGKLLLCGNGGSAA